MSPDARHGWAVLTLLVTLIAGFAVLTNQTPYCYTERVMRDGSVEYREFRDDASAFEYQERHDFWSGDPGVVSEESGCGSDKVFWWEGGIALTLIVIGGGIAFKLYAPSGVGEAGGFVLKSLLGLATMFAFAAILSVGSYIAFFLIPFQWLAARRSGRWTRWIWILCGTGSSWLAGSALSYILGLGDEGMYVWAPAAVAGVVMILFIWSTRPTSARSHSLP